MSYCFDCLAREQGYKDGYKMFTEMVKSLSPMEIANQISVDYHTVLTQLKKCGVKVNTWGGRNVKINGRFRRVNDAIK